MAFCKLEKCCQETILDGIKQAKEYGEILTSIICMNPDCLKFLCRIMLLTGNDDIVPEYEWVASRDLESCCQHTISECIKEHAGTRAVPCDCGNMLMISLNFNGNEPEWEAMCFSH